jgi:hypothetical protein
VGAAVANPRVACVACAPPNPTRTAAAAETSIDLDDARATHAARDMGDGAFERTDDRTTGRPDERARTSADRSIASDGEPRVGAVECILYTHTYVHRAGMGDMTSTSVRCVLYDIWLYSTVQ